MPLRALFDSEAVLAPLCEDAVWEDLGPAARTDRDRLRMPCCGHPCLPRTSKLGTRHFAHRPGADCVLSAGETIHHLQLKTELVRALSRHGFDVDTEVAGDDWRADVLATHGHERVAFEVQWSSQPPEETLARSMRYARSGLRVVWLLRQRVPQEVRFLRDLICVGVTNPASGQYLVNVGGQRVSVGDFVRHWATGALHLTLHSQPRWPALHAHRFAGTCPTCGEFTPIVAFAPAPGRTSCGLPQDEDGEVHRAARWRLAAELRARRIPGEERRMLPVHEPGRNAVPWRQGCAACNAELKDSWARRALKTALVGGAQTEVIYTHREPGVPVRSYPYHWCLAPEHGGCEREAYAQPTAESVAEVLAGELGARGATARVRTPSGPPFSGRSEVMLVDLPERRVAVLYIRERPGKHELAMWRARLATHRKLRVLTANAAALTLQMTPSGVGVVEADSSEGLTVVAGRARLPLTTWARTLIGEGPKYAERLRPASNQTMTVFSLGLRCWRCNNWYDGVATGGAWVSRCGQRVEDMRLWDEAVGRVVTNALGDGRLQLRANLQHRHSQTMAAFGDQPSGWANVCAQCNALYGQTFLESLTECAWPRGVPLRFPVSELAAPPSWEEPHYCDSGCDRVT